MKAKPLKPAAGGGLEPCAPAEATHVLLHVPGPFPYRLLAVAISHAPVERPCWIWNGSTEAPTLNPSILSSSHDDRCHSFVTDGRIRFLDDCTHGHRGKTMDLLDVEWD